MFIQVMNLLSAGLECYSVRDDRHLSASPCYVKTELCFRVTRRDRCFRTDQNLYLLYPHPLWKKKKKKKKKEKSTNTHSENTISIIMIYPQKYRIN